MWTVSFHETYSHQQKVLTENFRLPSSWDLLPRFLHLYIKKFCCWRPLNLTLSDLFISRQDFQSFGDTFTPVNDKALQMFSFKTSSVMSAGRGFNSIVSLLLLWEFAIAFQLYNPCQYMWIKFFTLPQLSYFDKKSVNFSSRLLNLGSISLTKLELIICKFLNELFFTHILILTSSQNSTKKNVFYCLHVFLIDSYN